MLDIWAIAAILKKLMQYIGILGATGLVIIRPAFPDLVSPLSDRIRLQAVILAGLALVAAVLGLMLCGAALTGAFDGMTDPEMLSLLWPPPVRRHQYPRPRCAVW
jgi:putative copper resistance protein D